MIGSVVGASVSGVIAYLIQSRAFREERKKRVEDHLRIQKALAHSVLFKLMQMHSDFVSVIRLLDECYEDANKAGIDGEPWQIVQPPSNVFDFIHYTPDEMGMILSLEEDGVIFNQAMDMDEKHNSMAKVITTLVARRRALFEQIRPDDVDGNTISGQFDRQTYLTLRPRMVEVNDLIEIIRTDAKKYADESLEAISLVGGLFKKHLGLNYMIASKYAYENPRTL